MTAYFRIMEEIKAEWASEKREATFFELAEEIDRRLKELENIEWTVGFRDRGMGHGDFGVVTKEGEYLIVECAWQRLAEYIVTIHNEKLESNNGT